MTRSLLLACMLGACGSGSASVALDDAPDAYARAYCDRIFSCCSSDEIANRFATVTPPVTDAASCRSYIARVFGTEFVDDTRTAEASGRARYAGDRMAACLDALQTAACPDLARVFALLVMPDACSPPRIPLTEDGAPCDHDFQCISSLCASSGSDSAGTCAAAPAAGAPCASGKCGAGYCDRSAGSDGVCVAIGDAGAACSSALACRSLVCNAGVCGAPTTCVSP